MMLSILKSLYWVPVLGRMLREAVDGPTEAMYVFLGNIVMSIVLMVLLFGFPALLVTLFIAVISMFIVIFDITRG